MITVNDRERIRRAHFVEHKSVRQIARELKHSRKTVKQALASAEPARYTLQVVRAAPVLGPYKARIDQLLAENEQWPPKQRYTSHKIYGVLWDEGFRGGESTVRGYVAQRRREQKRPKVYLPLEFDPGLDAQVDWGEALAVIAGELVTVHLFYMRLCYSRRLFMMAFPAQRQEAFTSTGSVQAWRATCRPSTTSRACPSGSPMTISKRPCSGSWRGTCLRLAGNRDEQQAFTVLRSHYLFEARFCTPGQGHEKGGVEHGVGFGRRNFMVPIPQVASFPALNAHLLQECLADDQRRVDGQPVTIGEAWAQEREALRPLPEHDLACRVVKLVTLTPYSQVEFETNRYSVPADRAQARLVLHAYPFQVDILDQQAVLASHPRCYGHQQDIFDPLHYRPLLEQRPGGFEHAKPIRRWRESWPPVYERLLARLQAQAPDGPGVREFVRTRSVKLHGQYPAHLVEQAVALALDYGCLHAAGVELCLRQLQQPPRAELPLDLAAWPQLAGVASQGPDLHCYDQLLAGR